MEMDMEEQQALLPDPDLIDGDQSMADLPQQSSDSDSDSEVDEAQEILQLQNLEKDLAVNPNNYEAHVQCIKLLRKMGDIEKLRSARESMNQTFPLTPSMWQDWARDESSLLAGNETFPAIEKIYEQGVSDYLSPSLWLDYLEFMQEHDPLIRGCSPAGIAKARDLFERALTAVGLHVGQGDTIWEAYREFELAIYLTIDESDIQAKEKQIQRIRSIFHRHLSVPLVNLRSTLLAYKAWEAAQGNVPDAGPNDLDGVPSHVASAYQKALDMYNARAHLEEKISGQDIPALDKFQEFMDYLKFEQTSGDPTRVQVMYERAVADFPVSTDLWLDYTRYIDKTLKVGRIVLGVFSRAIRNCPWAAELWIRYMLSLERSRASETEISDVYNKALQCTFSNIDDYLELFRTRVDGLRRRSNDVDNVLDFSLIRETFQTASDYLSPHMKNTDAFLHLYAYWARLELKMGDGLQAARGVWESFLKTCGSMLEAWQIYIGMELELGHLKEARSIYKRCYSKRFPGTGSEDICHCWMRFEREYGTLEDFDHAIRKVPNRLKELELFRSREESKLAEERESAPKKSVGEKRKPVSDAGDQQNPTKKRKDAGQNRKKVPEGKLEEHDIAEKKETEVVIVKEEQSIQKAEKSKDSHPHRPRVYTDQCTAFVSNLNFKASPEDLRKFFSDVGGVVGIRILKDKYTGKSRGLAYVDFSDDAHVAAAVEKNRQTLLGKKLSIARSNPKHGKKDQSGPTLPAKNTDQTQEAGGSASEESVNAKDSGEPQALNVNARKPRVDSIELKGKNTFAVPRNVRALNLTTNKPKTEEEGDEKPKSNDEFRKMFVKR